MRLTFILATTLLVAGCASKSPAPVSLMDDAPVRAAGGNIWIVYSASGRSELELERDAGARTRIYYKYRQNLPFVQINTIVITDVPSGAQLDVEELKSSGQLTVHGDTIFIEPPDDGLHWNLKVSGPPYISDNSADEDDA